jgi:hypothetical protein
LYRILCKRHPVAETSTTMNILSDRPIFAVDGEVFHWGDVVRHAQASGRWTELEAEARQGLACEAHFDTIEEDGVEEAIDEAATEFRYERDLITAEEMETWLEARGLTPEEWMGYVRRDLLRHRWAADLDEIAAEHPVADEELEGALRIDLLCSGTHRILAEELAVEAAAAAAASGAAPPASPEDRDAVLATLRQRAGRFRRDAVAPETLAREVSSNQMDWIRVDCRAIGFPAEGPAREAALCLREDGLDLEEVAGEADVPIEEVVLYLDQLDPEQHSRFLGATVNDVIGPVPMDEAFTVYQVVAKVMPSTDDPEIVRRAEQGILARLLAAEVSRRVRWHADF